MNKCCGNCEFWGCNLCCTHEKHKGFITPDYVVCPDYKEKPIDPQIVEFVQTHKKDILKILAAEIKAEPAVWIHSVSTAGGIWDKYDCSKCGYRTGHTKDYCPNCGAKMEGYDYDTKRKSSG